jgi:molybdopterin converting factor small subunit
LTGEKEITGLRLIKQIIGQEAEKILLSIHKKVVVKVIFYGVLPEVTGKSFRLYREVKSVDNLKIVLFSDYPLIKEYSYRISLNDKFICEDSELRDGDEIALIPPFEGG